MKKNSTKIILALVILLLFGLFFYFDLGRFLSFDFIKSSQVEFNNFYEYNPIITISIFFLIYVVAIALSFPGAAILTLLAGALFGLVVGTIVVSIASTLGALLATVASRYLFRDYFEKRFPKQLKRVNEGVEREGAFYLFTLRMIPIFPFFLINILMGLTKMRLWTYTWVSQIGMLAGTIVYVNAGTQLGALESFAGILSPMLIFSFVLLGVFPYIAKFIVSRLKTKILQKD